MQAREVAERHPGVDVVGEVPTDVVRHQDEPGRQMLMHGVGGLATVLRALHATVFSDGALLGIGRVDGDLLQPETVIDAEPR